MDFEKAKQAFWAWVQQYDAKEFSIKMKIDHTLRVVNMSEQIARELGLDQENIYVAKIIALLHDFARFPQWVKYRTFRDALSADHADWAARLLFDEGKIQAFGIDKNYYPLIRFAIENHNKFVINEGAVPTDPTSRVLRPILHSKIIRDADKIDIAWIVKNDGVEEFELTGPKEGTTVTAEILDRIYKHENVRHAILKTKADAIVSLMSQAYNLYTIPAKKLFIDEQYPIAIANAWSRDLGPESTAVIGEIAADMMTELKRQIAE